eukprot:1056653-Pyramimonas_sp.AAC.2
MILTVGYHTLQRRSFGRLLTSHAAEKKGNNYRCSTIQKLNTGERRSTVNIARSQSAYCVSSTIRSCRRRCRLVLSRRACPGPLSATST